ncbi:YqaJ viral recombinase family protein [Cupriavidus campinensis]|uniref:YqaJ viral recombinase family protein n=1 Tax=Cupriavidus campinensis TaxID=151783 RepID=A0AAE9HZ45_9BURK|nr:YqaJ viral recombinase family protein [Cupriavidus campinensis]URF03007.1 YqaJ viral recombinase family protein [Cupriavidus campinensis]
MTDYIVHNLVQGSPEWEAFRFRYHGASEAAAMLGLSSNMKRNELLHLKKTAMPKEFSSFVQERILDRGHELEALARPLVEEDLGEELYPVTCSLGKESASCDGLTMAGDIAFEHKQWNEELALAVENGNVPDSHMPQCQQILMVTGAERVRFVVSDGTRQRFVWTDVEPDQNWFNRIMAGWKQFDRDVEDYEPSEIEAKPEGRTPETLPALFVEVTGQVTASNLREYREHALAVFAGINKDLSSDQDFADAEKTVKWCGMVEDRLAAAKQHALSQTASIDELFRTIDDISAEARRVRLDLDKLVTRRKVEVKEAIIKGGRDAFAAHVQALKDETGGAFVQMGMPDFAGAAKGKRSVASIQDAVDTLLANSKIDADAAAKRIRDNIAYLDEAIKGFEFLFADRLGLCTRQLDDIKMVVSNRIEKHKLDEQRKEDETRERIRREEQAKAEREAAAKVAAEQAAQAAAARDEQAAAARATAPAPAERPAPAATRPAAQSARRPAARPTRPTDAQIIAALVSHFEATEEQVVGWICEMDFSAA